MNEAQIGHLAPSIPDLEPLGRELSLVPRLRSAWILIAPCLQMILFVLFDYGSPWRHVLLATMAISVAVPMFKCQGVFQWRMRSDSRFSNWRRRVGWFVLTARSKLIGSGALIGLGYLFTSITNETLNKVPSAESVATTSDGIGTDLLTNIIASIYFAGFGLMIAALVEYSTRMQRLRADVAPSLAVLRRGGELSAREVFELTSRLSIGIGSGAIIVEQHWLDVTAELSRRSVPGEYGSRFARVVSKRLGIDDYPQRTWWRRLQAKSWNGQIDGAVVPNAVSVVLMGLVASGHEPHFERATRFLNEWASAQSDVDRHTLCEELFADPLSTEGDGPSQVLVG